MALEVFEVAVQGCVDDVYATTHLNGACEGEEDHACGVKRGEKVCW